MVQPPFLSGRACDMLVKVYQYPFEVCLLNSPATIKDASVLSEVLVSA